MASHSLPTYRFIASLNEMNNIHERRVTALRYHIPGGVMFMLVGVAMVAAEFTGYHAGAADSPRRSAISIMSVTIAAVIMLVIDLDQPVRELIRLPALAVADAAQNIPCQLPPPKFAARGNEPGEKGRTSRLRTSRQAL